MSLFQKDSVLDLTEFPIGVATSSGRFSHALSFGDAEAATVFCKNATLADAAATAVGNMVKGLDVDAAIKAGIKQGLVHRRSGRML